MSAGSPSRVVASSSSTEPSRRSPRRLRYSARRGTRRRCAVELPTVDSVIETWDEARDERIGLLFSIAALAIWIYGTCRDRDALLLPTVATKLLEALWVRRAGAPTRRENLRAARLRSRDLAPNTGTLLTREAC
jgi:hypothetical protein